VTVIRQIIASLVVVTLTGCSAPLASAPQVPEATQSAVLQSSSPTASPSEEPLVGEPQCARTEGSKVEKVLACLDEATLLTPSNQVSLEFHLDPRLSSSAAEEIKSIALWALPYYHGYFTRLKRSATMHIIFPLDSKWCGEQVAEFDYGNPTPEATANSYLCGQDGGANAGHADSPSVAFVVVRPHPSLISLFKSGTLRSDEKFYLSLVAAEMGHASRSLMMESYTGELGGQPYWPIWAQYMANELMRLAADVRLGVQAKVAIDDRVWWMCERTATWRPDYGDRRLQSWETGGGIYGCPGGPGDQTNVDAPNHYNMAYLAGEHFTLTKGYDWMLQTFMPQPLKNRRADGTRDLDTSAKTLGWVDWKAVESELNENMWEILMGYGASIPSE